MLKKSLVGGIVAVATLAVSFGVSTSSLIFSSAASSAQNDITTGFRLNDGKPVITEHIELFEPGETWEGTFDIEHNENTDVAFRLYFENVGGELDDVIDVWIMDGEDVLYEGKISDLTADKTEHVEKMLAPGEVRTLTIRFYYPKEYGNPTGDGEVTFDLCADGVPTKGIEAETCAPEPEW